MNNYIDLYCERTMPGLWSEPLNATSNLSFLIAAWAIWQLAQRREKIPAGIWILITLTIAIGIGSFLFHTFAIAWASLLDVIPILLFQLCFLWLYSRQVIGLKYRYIGTLLVGFIFASKFSSQFTIILNGSLSYLPAFLILLGFGLYHYKFKKHENFVMLVSAGLFLSALVFRSLDQSICPYFSIGTHFIWHIFNSALLYFSIRGLILNWPHSNKIIHI
jgi:Ceramidase